MHFTLISALDIAFRLAAVGQLLLVCVLYLRRPWSGPKLSLLAVAIATGSYLLLTAPIPDAHYGVARNVLLTLTDALAYSVWFAAMYLLVEGFRPSRWPLVVKVALGVFALWYLYFFGVRQGRGWFHDFNHLLSVVVLAHVILVAVRGWNDDLLDGRRKSRIVIALLASGYGLMLAAVELFGPVLRHQSWYGLLNSAALFLAIPLLMRFLLQDETQGALQKKSGTPQGEKRPTPLPEAESLAEKLSAFLEQDGYRQTGLTIGIVAKHLGCAEYRLRRLINTELGFDNFSGFLNHYRTAEACRQLADPAFDRISILTLALDLGYGSIGPFNRAFRAETGLSPTEYRRRFQNRR